MLTESSVGTDEWGIAKAKILFDTYRTAMREIEEANTAALEHFDRTTDSMQEKRAAERTELEHRLLIKYSARQSALRALTSELLEDIQKAMIAYRTSHGLPIADLPEEVIKKPF